MRRLNVSVNDGVLINQHYRELVREVLAHRTLSRREEAVALRLPPDVAQWAATRSAAWITDLADRGYDVVGDLAELRAELGPSPVGFVNPDEVPEPPEPMMARLSVRARRAVVARADTNPAAGLAVRAYRRVKGL